MQSDDIIWSVIDQQFCSFKVKVGLKQENLCRNDMNLTGECQRIYCPLANSRYATVKEEAGVLYLHMKTIERAAFPDKLWEKVPLNAELPDAIEQINEHLAFWPQYMINKVKERLIRLHQYLIRYRKWYYRAQPRLVERHKKFETREKSREFKALMAAKLDFAIKSELMERLKKGTYGEMYNLNNKAFQEVIAEEKLRAELENPKLQGQRKFIPKPSEQDVENVKTVFNKGRTNKASVDIEDMGAQPIQFQEAEEEEENPIDVEDVELSDDDDNDDGEYSKPIIGNFEDEMEEPEEVNIEESEDKFEKLGLPPSMRPSPDDDYETKILKQTLVKLRERKRAALEYRQNKAKKPKKDYGDKVNIEYEYEYEPSATASSSSSRR